MGRSLEVVTKEEYEIALKNGISKRTVRYRIQKGYTKLQAITMETYKRRVGHI